MCSWITPTPPSQPVREDEEGNCCKPVAMATQQQAELFVWLESCCISSCAVSPSLHFVTWWMLLLETFFWMPARNWYPFKCSLPQQPTRFHCITKLICLKWDIQMDLWFFTWMLFLFQARLPTDFILSELILVESFLLCQEMQQLYLSFFLLTTWNLLSPNIY